MALAHEKVLNTFIVLKKMIINKAGLYLSDVSCPDVSERYRFGTVSMVKFPLV